MVGLAPIFGGFGSGGTAGGDPDTVFLCHWDGADGATAATDESLSGHTINFLGAAEISTTEKVFGTAALWMDTDTDATGTGVSIPNSADFQFGTDPFTVETRYYYGSNTDREMDLISFRTASSGDNNSWWLTHDDRSAVQKIKFFWSSSGGSFAGSLSGGSGLTVGTWYALAVDWDGTTLRLYVGGAVVDSTASFSGVFAANAPLMIGKRSGTAQNNASLARFDETRISKGVARYAGAYTPASEAFAA